MSITKNTLGPWYEASLGSHQGLVIDEKTGANVAVVYDKAHARLVAKAPEMKDALKAVVKRWEHGDLAEAVRHCAVILAELEG